MATCIHIHIHAHIHAHSEIIPQNVKKKVPLLQSTCFLVFLFVSDESQGKKKLLLDLRIIGKWLFKSTVYLSISTSCLILSPDALRHIGLTLHEHTQEMATDV